MRQSLLDGRVEFGANPLVVRRDFRARWPVSRLVARQTGADRVYAESKKLIKGSMKPAQAECTLAQEIPVECLDVAQIKNYPVAFLDRAFVKRFVAQNLEKLVSGTSGPNKSDVMIVTGADGGGECS